MLIIHFDEYSTNSIDVTLIFRIVDDFVDRKLMFTKIIIV